MTSRTEVLASLGSEWLVHRYDPDQDCFHFLRVDREVRQTIPFLTDEYLPQQAQKIVVSRDETAAMYDAHAPMHFVFHSAYCCSTVLVNALDQQGSFSGVKEPVVLNDLVGWRQRGGDPQRIGKVLTTALHLLARPLKAGEAVVVKPSNVVNGLAAAILSIRTDARAILLHAPLETYLTSIARKGMWGRLWVRELLMRQLGDGLVEMGFAPKDYLLHTDLQTAAVGWLAQQKLFSSLAATWPDRVRSLRSEVLTATPVNAVAACSQFFERPVPREPFAYHVERAFGRNAKNGSAFGATQRQESHQQGKAVHAEEVEQVVLWAQAVAQAAGIEMELPEALHIDGVSIPQ